jgi:hypothetical protein
MIKPKSLLMSLAFGTTVASLILTDSSASAAIVGNSCTGTDLGSVINVSETTFATNCGDITQLAKIQGRSGASGFGLNGDYEIAIGPNGAQANRTGILQLDWNDETVYNWTLDWNTSNNQAIFTLLNNGRTNTPGSISYIYSLPDLPFNAFSLVARADNPSTVISANTTMNLAVTKVALDGGTLTTLGSPLSVTATSSASGLTRFVKGFYTIDPSAGTEITKMEGTFKLDIPNGGLNPQDQNGRASGIGFELTLFDPSAIQPPQAATSVPEPASIFGLLSVASLGFTFVRKRKNQEVN